jgi:hypothetical protein
MNGNDSSQMALLDQLAEEGPDNAAPKPTASQGMRP